MANTNQVTASLVVNFSQAAGEGILLAEIDDRAEGLNGGDTTFYPGSSPGILLFKSSNVVIDKIVVSEGSLSGAGGQVQVPQDEWLTFANEKKASPKYPISAGGRVVDQAGIVGSYTISELGVTFGAPQIGVVRLNYYANAMQYRLTGASGTRPVVILIQGRTT